MNVFAWAGVLAVTALLQITILPLVSIAGTTPDLLLMLVVSVGLLKGKEAGVGIGFFSGLLQDVAVGGFLGLNMLAKLVNGYVFGMVERKVFKEHILLPLMTIAVATVLHQVVSISMLLLLGYKLEIWPVLVNHILPALGFNLVLCIPVHQLVCRVMIR